MYLFISQVACYGHSKTTKKRPNKQNPVRFEKGRAVRLGSRSAPRVVHKSKVSAGWKASGNPLIASLQAPTLQASCAPGACCCWCHRTALTCPEWEESCSRRLVLGQRPAPPAQPAGLRATGLLACSKLGLGAKRFAESEA